jgi:hypothetical protein
MRIPADRFKADSDGPEAAPIKLDEPATLKRLDGIPTLLFYEQCIRGRAAGTIRYGKVRDVGRNRSWVIFRFDQEGRFTRAVLAKFADRLDIMVNRTHWAIKEGDIPSAMKSKLIPLAGNAGKPSVGTPDIVVTSESVNCAIREAELSLSKGSAIGAVDRVHTTLHGYLRELCIKHELVTRSDGDLTINQLWKKLRAGHPMFKKDIPHVQHVDKIMGGISAGLDALNPIRNHGSMSHPNDHLLEEPESHLVVNFARSVLDYVNRRLKPTKP